MSIVWGCEEEGETLDEVGYDGGGATRMTIATAALLGSED